MRASATRSDYLFFARSLRPLGGEEALAARCLQCLLQRGSVTVVTDPELDLKGLDRMAGTSLASASFEIIPTRSPFFEALSRLGVPTRLLSFRRLVATVRAHRRRGQPCISIGAELDLGPSEGVWQYIATAPRFHSERLRAQNLASAQGWMSKALALLNIALCNLLVPFSDARTAGNVTAAVSQWIGQEFQELYGRPADLVLHPAPLGFSHPPEKKPVWGFVSPCRAEPNKAWLAMIELVRRLRERGHAVSFTMLGLGLEEDDFVRLLRAEAERNGDWLRFELNAPRERLDQVLSDHAFGLHLALREGYGMAVAEMMLAGCLTGVADSGGQTEIVTEPELRFASLDDAVEKWHLILSDPDLLFRLQASQQARRLLYTREAFEANFHRAMDDFEAGLARA